MCAFWAVQCESSTIKRVCVCVFALVSQRLFQLQIKKGGWENLKAPLPNPRDCEWKATETKEGMKDSGGEGEPAVCSTHIEEESVSLLMHTNETKVQHKGPDVCEEEEGEGGEELSEVTRVLIVGSDSLPSLRHTHTHTQPGSCSCTKIHSVASRLLRDTDRPPPTTALCLQDIKVQICCRQRQFSYLEFL